MELHLNLKSIYSKLRLSFTESRAKRNKHEKTFRWPILSYLTASIIRYEAKNVMPSEEKEQNIYRREDKEEEEEWKREKGNNCAARVHAKSERRRSVPTSIPRCCGRSYVRASRCYDPISIPPWAPRPFSATPPCPSPNRLNDPSRAPLVVHSLLFGLTAISPRS